MVDDPRTTLSDGTQVYPGHREIEAREECERLDIDPDDIVADGGVTAWMVVAQELRERRARCHTYPRDK